MQLTGVNDSSVEDGVYWGVVMCEGVYTWVVVWCGLLWGVDWGRRGFGGGRC